MAHENVFRKNHAIGQSSLYSISEFVRGHRDLSIPNTATQYWNSMSNITNYDTMIKSNILEDMAMFLGDLSDDDFTT